MEVSCHTYLLELSSYASRLQSCKRVLFHRRRERRHEVGSCEWSCSGRVADMCAVRSDGILYEVSYVAALYVTCGECDAHTSRKGNRPSHLAAFSISHCILVHGYAGSSSTFVCTGHLASVEDVEPVIGDSSQPVRRNLAVTRLARELS
jgi:hypothetical protein